MNRRGHCHDNLLKREGGRRKVYRTRDEARRDVLDSIEMFYNPTRKHARNGMPSPIEFERQHKAKAEGVQKTRGDSRARCAVIPPRRLCSNFRAVWFRFNGLG